MMRTRSLLLILVLYMATAGCDMKANAGDSPGKPAPKDSFKPVDAETAVNASNKFGVNLYRKAAQDSAGGNLFISPYSISVAMAMAAEGARDQTLLEMADVLGFAATTADAKATLEQLAKVHAANSALAKHFAVASGDPDPKTRTQIQTLRDKLDEANLRANFQSKLGRYKEANEEVDRARKIADELNSLLATVDRYELRVANALWVEKSFPLLDSYTQTVDRHYGTGLVRPLDIRGATESSRLQINGWVEDHTANRIKDLIARGMLTPDTSLVITNAVYFLGQWSEPFKRDRTREEDFTKADGAKSRVQMMQDSFRKSLAYAAFDGKGAFFDTPLKVPVEESRRPATYPGDDGFQVVSLPYKGGEMSMVLLLPSKADGLAALEAKLSAENLDKWIERLSPRTVDLKMPRFKLEGDYKLGQMLQAMGIKRAFTNPGRPDGAQFFGMSKGPDPTKLLFIGEVVHKAWVDVNEEGTEAAAATAVMMLAGAAAPSVEMIPFNPKFHADRPFIFLIRDAKSGVILFMGRVQSPSN
ncbi:MAG: serpin family protein [Planctomycetes bacterium]|nr:serpin family protein [Planctomycetota bacterium]